MGYIVGSVLILFALVLYVREKSIANLGTFFCGLWGIICILSNMRLFGMYDFDEYVYAVVAFGCAGFLISYFVGLYTKKRVKNILASAKNMKKGTKSRADINLIVYRVLLVFAFVYYLILFVQLLYSLRSGTSYYMFRRMYQGYEEASLYASSLQRYLASYIAVPAIFILEPVCVMWLFSKKYKRHGITYISSVITVLLYIVSAASRFAILTIVLQMLFCVKIYKREIPPKFIRYIKRLSVLLLVGIIILTAFRQSTVGEFSSNWGLLESAYAYITVTIPIMAYWIEHAKKMNWITFGMTFFRAPASFLHLIVLNRIGIRNSGLLNNTLFYLNSTDEFLPIFPRHTYNAFTSMFYYFFLDFREIGVFLGGLLFGIITSRAMRVIRHSQSENNVIMFLLIVTCISRTMVTWPFSTPSFFMAIVFALLLRVTIEKEVGEN